MGEYLPTGLQLFFPEKAFDANSLKGAGGVFNSINNNIYHYAGLNPIKHIDPDGKVTIAIELNPFNPSGGVALQVENGKVNFYGNWVTRGVSVHGQGVAIQSGVYDYKMADFHGQQRPLLENGKKIPTTGPNKNHLQNGKAQWVADKIFIHGMSDTATPDADHGNKNFVGSEGCNGPQKKDGKGINDFVQGKQSGDKGKYILIRPLGLLERAYNYVKEKIKDD